MQGGSQSGKLYLAQRNALIPLDAMRKRYQISFQTIFLKLKKKSSPERGKDLNEENQLDIIDEAVEKK